MNDLEANTIAMTQPTANTADFMIGELQKIPALLVGIYQARQNGMLLLISQAEMMLLEKISRLKAVGKIMKANRATALMLMVFRLCRAVSTVLIIIVLTVLVNLVTGGLLNHIQQ